MDIYINRGLRVSFEELPPKSIALDGYCVGGPRVDLEHKKFNFDHHDGCLRFATLATCQQVFAALSLGLDPSDLNIYCNDVDLDVCLSIFLLQNYERLKEPLLKKLVDAVGTGDAYLGAISLNGMQKIVSYVSAPEKESKRQDDYSKISKEGLNTILEAVLHRIELYLAGEAGEEISKCQKHNEYKILKNENGWVMVESGDSHIYSTLYQNGFDRIVLVRKQADGSNAVSLAKKSDFIDNFPLEIFYEELNKIEPVGTIGRWGGGSSTGGAPRNPDGSRSRISLDDIAEVINRVIQNQQ
jgi:hypothetical protein